MNPSGEQSLELDIWKEIAGLQLSVSHDRWHIDRVLRYALGLRAIHGGDRDVITAAVLMHDLGRGDADRRHGLLSVEASIEQARALLEAINFPSEKLERVLVAISEHDQPEVRPQTIEGRILKDADFLAGFGAWGILRIAMWSGETHRRMPVVLNRLMRGMERRFASLEFAESRATAAKEIAFVRTFVAQLQADVCLETRHRGLYIVLEGISGSGKDTQRDLLAARLREQGFETAVVGEPGDAFRKLRDGWRTHSGQEVEDAAVKRSLLMIDRRDLIEHSIAPALDQGKIVISARNYLSTLVYQCETREEAGQAVLAHQWIPRPDLLILLDLSAELAQVRINAREKEPGEYETPEQLAVHRQRYRELTDHVIADSVQVVDAGEPQDAVSDQIWRLVEGILESRAGQLARTAQR